MPVTDLLKTGNHEELAMSKQKRDKSTEEQGSVNINSALRPPNVILSVSQA